jgi:hypothetical protein
MNNRHLLGGWGLAVTAAMLAGCGGGGGDSTPTPPPAVTTTNVATRVVDGPLRNALVCLDKNGNGVCDAGEPQARSDASGNATLVVDNADVGKFPILALVGTDAVDTVTGPVTTAYAMSTPADQPALVSPLTTLVQQTVATTGATTAAAAQSVRDATGITASLFQDYTAAAAPSDGSIDPGTVARMIVVTTQRQATVVAAAVGTPAIDGKAITQADIDKAIQKKVLDLLPDMLTAISDPAVAGAASAQAREAALLAAANTLVAAQGLSSASMPTVVAINTQTSASAPVVATPPAPSVQLHTFSFASAGNYFARFLTGSTADNTPDSNNKIRYLDRRFQASSGNVAAWSTGANPSRNADLHWNGSAWVGCPINFPNVATVRDAQGNSVYDYCDQRETGSSNRATFDVSGMAMSAVYAQIRAAGYTNLSVATPTDLGSATFPAGSSVFYQASTPLTNAFAYYPGSGSPAGLSDVVNQYSAAVSAGGDATAQPAGQNCNATETQGNGTSSTTLESMIAAMSGTPCVFAPGSFVYQGTTYNSGSPNEWWGNSTASIGTLGTAPVGGGPSPGFYTSNTRIRVAFKGTGVRPVTYYACKERFNNGSSRNCTVIGTGSYTITTLGNGRVLTLSNPPTQTAPLNYNRVFVERGGLVYLGYQSKPIVSNSARLNTVATTALLTQLGVPTPDASAPLALTAGSYQGSYDVFANAETTASMTIFVQQGGSFACQDRATLQFDACTLTITNPATGAFTFADSSSTANGVIVFGTGAMSGTYHDPSAPIVDGTFTGQRR